MSQSGKSQQVAFYSFSSRLLRYTLRKMTDRNLEEAIFQLQKLNTENGVKKLADEAAQLFANGRQIEASALMEKAEAMIAAKSSKHVPALNHQSSTPVTPQEKPKVEERAKVDEQAMTNMAGKLADGLSKILMGAFQELERHIVGESRKVSTSIEQQLGRLQATVDSFTQLQAKFEHLTETVSEQRSTGTSMVQKYEQISTSVTALEEVSANRSLRCRATKKRSGLSAPSRLPCVEKPRHCAPKLERCAARLMLCAPKPKISLP